MTAKTDVEVVNSMDDAEFLRRPHLWPGPGGIVCLQKHPRTDDADVNADLGFIHPLLPLTVACGNMLVAPVGERQLIAYESVEAILADGWRVD